MIDNGTRNLNINIVLKSFVIFHKFVAENNCNVTVSRTNSSLVDQNKSNFYLHIFFLNEKK